MVPDREAALIPFEVLPLPSQHAVRVIDNYAVSYLPSASSISGKAEDRRAWQPFWKPGVLAFANPAQGSGKPVLDIAFPNLPAAADEAAAIAGETGGRSSLFTGAQATKANLRSALPKHFPILHFATHAFADPENPARSFILMAPSSPAQTWDYLFLGEVPALDLHDTQLVTVSACETEKGKLVEGEGIEGFSRAFLAAGAGSVVTSLWPVSDRSTDQFMQIFYKELARGARAAQALQTARKEYGVKDRAHPYYWAGFILNGDPDTQVPRFVPGRVAGILTTAGLFALFGFLALAGNRRGKAAIRIRVQKA